MEKTESMIIDDIVQHLNKNGLTAYAAGNAGNIERKPNIVISLAGKTQPWLPLSAWEFRIVATLTNSGRSESYQQRFLSVLESMPLTPRCDLFQLEDVSESVEDDDFITSYTIRYIEQ